MAICTNSKNLPKKLTARFFIWLYWHHLCTSGAIQWIQLTAMTTHMEFSKPKKSSTQVSCLYNKKLNKFEVNDFA